MRGRRDAFALRPKWAMSGNALFLVDDQVLDDVEVLGLRLARQALRRVAVVAAVVHVHVQVGADPVAELARKRLRLQAPRGPALSRPAFASMRRCLDRMGEAMLHGHLGRARRDFQRARRSAVEVVRFAGEPGAVEAVVCMHPRRGGRMRATVAALHRDPRGHAAVRRSSTISSISRAVGASVRRLPACTRCVAPPTTSITIRLALPSLSSLPM